VDAEGGRFFETIRKFAALKKRRKGLKAEQFETVSYRIDGKMFERWSIKTAINIAHVVGTPLEWFENLSPVRNPPLRFVEAAYGVTGLTRPYGLFQSNSAYETVRIEDAVTFQPLLILGNKLIGFEFRLGGFKFLLWLCSIYPNKAEGLLSNIGNTWGNLEEPLQPGSISHEVDGKMSQIVNFVW